MYLAELNIAHGKDSIESPLLTDFRNNVDRINALAEAQDGFVWRLQEENGDATAIQAFDNPNMLVNMSVWKTKEDLFKYVYETQHIEILKRKKEWFHHIKEMSMVFWYIEETHVPTVAEAKIRLEYLRKHGETPYAFSFKSKFTIAEAKEYKPIV